MVIDASSICALIFQKTAYLLDIKFILDYIEYNQIRTNPINIFVLVKNITRSYVRRLQLEKIIISK